MPPANLSLCVGIPPRSREVNAFFSSKLGVMMTLLRQAIVLAGDEVSELLRKGL